MEILNAGKVQPVERLEERLLLAVASWLGSTRLIDKVTVEVPTAS